MKKSTGENILWQEIITLQSCNKKEENWVYISNERIHQISRNR